MAGTVAEANAVVCARGAYHAGCAGARGAVVAPRGYHGAAVVRPGVRCTVNRYGRRVRLTAGQTTTPAVGFLRRRYSQDRKERRQKLYLIPANGPYIHCW